jgi:hypothetical protein
MNEQAHERGGAAYVINGNAAKCHQRMSAMVLALAVSHGGVV